MAGRVVIAAPTTECYWVTPSLLAGKYPGAKFDVEADDKIAALVAAGVRTFIDLTEPGELLPYANRLPANVEHQRIGVVDVTCPQESQVRLALDLIDAAVEEGIVYLHCRGGCGRTGVIVGCYLVRHGEDPARALSRVHDLTRALWNKPCPETDDQLAMVKTWSASQ